MIFDPVRRLERKQRALERSTQAKVNHAVNHNLPKDSVNKLYDVTKNYVAFLEEVRQRALSERLRTQAVRLNLPVPAKSEWIKGDKSPLPYMSPAVKQNCERPSGRNRRNVGKP
jgi:hypothetical protein